VVLAVVVYMNFYLLGGRVVFEEPTRMSAWTRKRQKVIEWNSLSQLSHLKVFLQNGSECDLSGVLLGSTQGPRGAARDETLGC
jgi:hypothetical protein